MNFKKKTKQLLLRDGTKVDKLIIRLLEKNGLKTYKEMLSYLEPHLQDLPKPDQMHGLPKAAAIIGDSILANTPILIWGDYDVDGTTATALLLLFFKSLKYEKVAYYIPNRLVEGYGLQSEPLKTITKTNCTDKKILITVDNGISAHSAVQTAKDLGYQVIVTDHHTPPELRVDADAVLNPRQKECAFPGKNLAGVGVAFYLAVGVRTYLQKKQYFNDNIPVPNMKQLLDLVAIGTVADMVQLDKTNRILVRAGLETVANKTNPGITSLCAKTSLDSSLLRSEDISFQIAPKINAAGRLGYAAKAVSLLTSQSKTEADELCDVLIKTNLERKVLTVSDLSRAIIAVEDRHRSVLEDSIVVAGDFHIGVAGIVASNLVEKYHKPTIVLCEQSSGLYKGSARSIDGLNLYNALEECRNRLIGFGGHAMAAGMSLKIEQLDCFRKEFNDAVCALQPDAEPSGGDSLVEEIGVCELFNNAVLKQLLLLEPHGTGNPQPTFSDTDTTFSDLKRIGGDKSHLKFVISSGSTVVNAIAFGKGELYKKCTYGKVKRILYSPAVNYFRGKRSWQARVIDIQFNNR